MNKKMENIIKKWDAPNYQDSFSFVHQYGEDVMQLLDLSPEMKVLDIGAGTGVLTKKIKEKGVEVVGIDQSKEMLERAKKNAPGISFIHMNATEIPYVEEFDAVFSNAVFHWIDDQDKLLTNIARSLKMNGQLVCEFGGVGCAKLVHETLEEVFSKYGLQYINYFYFPSIGEYAPRLEKAGLKVEYAYLFDRPTFLKKGETVIDWINMFVTQAFEGIESSLKQQILEETKEKLKPYLMKEEGWWIDYVRIRIKAIK